MRNEKRDYMKMQLTEKLITNRLIIRTPVFADAEQVFKKYAQDIEVTKYLTWTPHSSITITQNFMKWCIDQWNAGECFPFSICLKENEELIGMMDTRITDYKADFGYVLAKQYWNKGYTAEALITITNELFQNDKIYRIWAVCDTENYGSKRVMEKVGMQYEGILKKWIIHPNISKIPRDCFVYSIVK